MKNYTLLIISIAFFGSVKAQLLFDNGPLINYPEKGAGGADVSATHSGITTYGSGHAIAYKYRVADEFTIPDNATWTIDSIVFFAYQTLSTTTSTMDAIHLQVWEGSPMLPESFVLMGDSVTNMLSKSSWSGIYRTTDMSLDNIDRPIMRNVVDMSATTLTGGTYWLDWSTGGSLPSGPWVPIVTDTVETTTGNAIQYNPNSNSWVEVIDGGTLTAQGFPFLIYGSSVTGIVEEGNSTSVNLFPNPFNGTATVKISSSSISPSENGFTFVIYDMLGKEVNSRNNIKTSQFTINSNDLSKGVYIYQLLNDKELLKTGRLVVD